MKEFNFRDRKEKQKFYNTYAWRKLRKLALARDNFECVWCRAEGKVSNRFNADLEVDHIEEVEDRPDLALDLDNLRTLCMHHHNVRHNRYDGRKEAAKIWNDERW